MCILITHFMPSSTPTIQIGWNIIMVNGHVYPQIDDAKVGTTYREPKLVFQNQRDGSPRSNWDERRTPA
jgi:hypothetical protein